MSRFSQNTERRQFGRRRTFLHGWIRLAGRPAVTCIVHDLSQGGAMLELPENVWLPFRFHITIESERIATDCEVRHQRGNRVGICFLDEAEKPAGGPHRGGHDDVGSWGGRQAARTIRSS